MEFGQDGCDRSGWLTEVEKPLKQIHIVDTMQDFHYGTSLKSMYMDVVKPTEDQRLYRSSKTGLLLRDNETINGPCTLSTEGIAGAQVPPLYKFTNRGVHAFSNLPKTWEDLPRSKPKALIPEHVNRQSKILDSRDIKGTSPHPKNMKIGDEARNTNPIDPHYILPSYPEPFIPLPKFVKNSLDVADIEGTRPSSRQKKSACRSEGRGSLHVTDIEGTQPGWKPSSRRQIGKAMRNLSLDVEDINGLMEERVVRPLTSEVYRDITGSHSRGPSVGRRPGTPHTMSLRSDDIEASSHSNKVPNQIERLQGQIRTKNSALRREDRSDISCGANAGSGSWEGTTRRKKEFAKSHSRTLTEQMDAEAVALSILTRRVQEQLKRKGLQPTDVAATFQQLDRQKSGKLEVGKVNRAFKTLRLDLDSTDMKSISNTFVHPAGDGHLDYWKLLKHFVPFHPKQRGLQRDVSDIVARSMNQGVKSNECHKPCYDPAWVADLVATRESRVSDGESGTQFQAFNSGRPVSYDPSRYLKDPPSKCAMEGESYEKPQIQIANYKTDNITEATKEPRKAPSGQEPSSHTGNEIIQCVTREVPVLSVLPESVPQPTWVNKDASFQEINRREAKQLVGRKESIFSEVRSSEFPPGGNNANSVPIFYKLNGMDSYESKPLPFGGPFWPGFVESQPEELAPPRPKTPNREGPLPMGDTFWSVDKPQSAPRISLRRDYPVPPLYSEINSEVNLRKAGQEEKVFRTWVDTVGQGTSGTTFVGEGDQVLSRSGMQGSAFSRPSSAILPHNYGHRSTWKSEDQPDSRPQTATSLAHSYCSGWTPEEFPMERGRPQTVNSIARGSPAENILNTANFELKSAMKRPSTAQSVASSVRSGVTFSPFPSRPCTPHYPVPPNRAPCVAPAHQTVSTRIRTQSQLHSSGSHRGNRKSIPVSTQRLQAQLWEDVNSVRLLI